MKISNLLTILSLAFSSTLAQDISVCLTDVDPNIDYFATKVTPTASKGWSIEYFNTYKIVSNIAEGERYLLYQCGSTPPQDVIDNGNITVVVPIPVANVGIDITPAIPFLEQLGLVDRIVAFTSDPQYISSPCLLSSIADGNVVVLQSRDELDDFTATPETSNEILLKLQNAVGFIAPYNVGPPFNVSVKISEYVEVTNSAIFEWIKYYSAFFNLEATANEIFDLTESRWECVADAASTTQTDSPDKPKVFWATYVAFCGGWDVGECPNYYCEYADSCSASIIETSLVGNYSAICDASYLSIEEIVEIGKDADYWIYPAPDWNETYVLFKDQLDNMTVVQNKEVYDFQGSGPNSWFEQRFAEYFAVLQDFCSVVGTTPSFANRTYFRNVMDGTPIGGIGMSCTENSRSNSILPVIGAVCDDFNPPPVSTPSNPTAPVGSPGSVPTPNSNDLSNNTSGAPPTLLCFSAAIMLFMSLVL